MQLYYIRHAQSANNELYSRTGSWEGRSEDPELTALGWQQAEWLADFLTSGDPDGGYIPPGQPKKGFSFTHLYTSLMLRTVCTGTTVADRLGLPLVGQVDLHELGGVMKRDFVTDERTGMPGKNRSFFQENYPNLLVPEEVGEEGWWNRPVETEPDFLPRAQRVFRWLLDTHGGTSDRVALFSHGAFFKVFFAALVGLDSTKGLWSDIHNTSISRFDFEDGKIRLRYVNRMDFFPEHMITY